MEKGVMHNKGSISIMSTLGLRLMVIFALLDGTAGMFIKLLAWNPFVIAGCRSAIVAVLLYVYSLGIPEHSGFSGKVIILRYKRLNQGAFTIPPGNDH